MSGTQRTLNQLRRYESRNVTFLDPDGTWPVVWDRAQGVHVWDAEGRKYLDLTAAFGVAAAGHANPRVVRAGQKQMSRLLHAMGDVHPHALKVQLARELSRLTFERWARSDSNAQSRTSKVKGHVAHGKTIFCNSGFEAVEAALKTARLATGKAGIIAFEGAYHGLGYGALNATHREHFRGPFLNQLRQFGSFVSFPKTAEDLQKVRKQITEIFRRNSRRNRHNRNSSGAYQGIAAVLVEPIQVRGGINLPPPGFLPMLRTVCDRFGALLILDEIYTGFGRTGAWFACEHSETVPDLICLGKALTGGFPLSACVGRADVMDAAWPTSQGEAIHTSTFLGHPVGCAMALAQIEEIKRLALPERSRKLGALALELLVDEPGRMGGDKTMALGARTALSALVPAGKKRSADKAVRAPFSVGLPVNVRGMGLLIGIELLLSDGKPATSITLAAIKQMLQQGYILLPEGEYANVISLTPPLTISESQLRTTIHALAKTLRRLLA